MDFDDFEEECMPADCRSCDYCTGYDDVGIPNCSYNNGYEDCPFFEKGKIIMNNAEQEKSTLNISISTQDMEDRILFAFKNTISEAVNAEIARIVKGEFEEQIKKQTLEIIQQKIKDGVNVLFAQNITICGKWNEEPKTMTREEYLFDEIGKQLSGGFVKEEYDKRIAAETKKQIDDFAYKTKQNVNMAVKKLFDTAMQQNLTDSIVNVLMQNETYQRLNASVQNILEMKK